MTNSKTKIIGICGGSASGKTTLAHLLQEKIGRDSCTIISMDNFYYDFVSRGIDPAGINYDHPDSIDMGALRRILENLQQGNDVQIPVYDFRTHTRLTKTISLSAPPWIIVDGLFLFNIPELKDCFHLKIFIETPDEIRLKRRIERDTRDRGRSEESVRIQFRKTVLPMHNKFVMENRGLADVIVPGCQTFNQRIISILELI